jgi:hypothetical protein
MVGASRSPVAEAIVERSFQMRCTLAPGIEAKTSLGAGQVELLYARKDEDADVKRHQWLRG